MSTETAHAFISHLSTRPELLAEVSADGADVVAIAARAGYHITETDLTTAAQSLSDQDLDAVAGGQGTGWLNVGTYLVC